MRVCRQKVEAPPKQEASKPFSALEENKKLNAYSSGLLHVDDIDVEDSENPQLVSEYIKDIYLYLRYMEVRMCKCRNGPSSGQSRLSSPLHAA